MSPKARAPALAGATQPGGERLQPEETPAEAIESLRQDPLTETALRMILHNDASAWLWGDRNPAGREPASGAGD